MIPPFDILRVDASGARWMQASATLEDAKVRVAELMKVRPGEYLIVSKQTGRQVAIKPEGRLDKKRVAEIYTASKRERWAYSRVFEALQAAGVEGYVVDVASHTVIYYGDNSSCIENSPPDFTGITPQKHFDPAALRRAMQRHQEKETDYTTFLAEIAKAGVISYQVEMKTGTITYKSGSGQQHVEMVP